MLQKITFSYKTGVNVNLFHLSTLHNIQKKNVYLHVHVLYLKVICIAENAI